MLTENIYISGINPKEFLIPSPVLLPTDLHGPGVGPELGQQPVDVNVAPRLPVDPLRHHPVAVHEFDALKMWDAGKLHTYICILDAIVASLYMHRRIKSFPNTINQS